MKFRLIEDLNPIEYDSEGNELSPEQSAFFKNSKIRDPHGNLKVMYHGTDATFDIFDKGRAIGGHFGAGFYFGNKNVASNYGNTKAYYLNITKPYNYFSIDGFRKMLKQLDAKGIDYDTNRWDWEPEIFTDEPLDWWESDPIDVLESILINYGKNESKLFSELVQEQGYDGIDEGDEIIAFDPNQIKLTTNKTPTNSDNINEWLFHKKQDDDIEELDDAEVLWHPDPSRYNLLKLPDFITDRWIDKYFPNYTKQEVSIDQVMSDTNNLENDAMKTRRTSIWGIDPDRYEIKSDKYNYDTSPIRLEIKNGKYRVLDDNHRLRAISNAGYKNAEVLVKNEE